MNWRERNDVWYGTALARPQVDSNNAQYGGAYVSFFVIGNDVGAAVRSLIAAVADRGWSLTSLLKMNLASDFEGGDDDKEFDDLARKADASGVSLGAIHTFPKEERRSP